MAITGNDLLKKRKKTTNEEEEEKKVISGEDLLKRYKAYQSVDISTVDQRYIDSFKKDADTFFSTASKDYDGIGWSNASSTYDSRNATWEDLSTRADTIGAWLYKNRNSFNSETYNSLNNYLNDIRNNGSSVLNTFKRELDYYSQWETEEDYNKDASYQKDVLRSFDLEAGMAEIEALEKKLADIKIPENEARGIEAAEKMISELRQEQQMLELRRAKGDKEAAEQYKKNEETINFYLGKIKEVRNQYSSQRGELTSLISQKKQYYTLAERAQKAVELASVADPDSENYDVNFDEYATQGETMDDGKIPWAFWGKTVADNPIEALRRYYADSPTISVEEDYGAGKIGKEASFALAMTEDEVNIYNYYLAKEGKEKADEYLDLIAEDVNSRVASGLFSQVENKPLLEYAFGVSAGLDQFVSGVESLFSNEDYIPTSAMQYASSMVREDLSDNGAKLPDWLGGKNGTTWGQVGYDAITTTSNMLPSILVSFVPVVGQSAGAVMLGASAAGNAKAEMLRLGYSKEQATTYGIMVGVTEVAMEKLLGAIPGISNGGGIFSTLSNKAISKIDNALARVSMTIGSNSKILEAIAKVGLKTAKGVVNLAGGALDEALEEGLQTIIEPWLAEVSTSVDWDDPTIDEVLYSSLLGAISSIGLGGGFNAIGSTANAIDNKIQYNQAVKKHGQSIIDKGGEDLVMKLALEQAGATQKGESKKLTKLANKVEAKPSAKNVGKLSARLESTITNENRADIQKALAEKGLSEKDAKRVAEYLGSAETLTAEQNAEIEGNESIKAVVTELLDDPKSAISERTRNLMAARLGMKINAEKSGELSLRNDVDVKERVSETGKTTITETDENGKEVTKDITIDKSNPIAKVKYVGDERVVYLNTDHGTVEASKVKYASKDEALLYEAFTDMNPAFANAVIKNYDNSVPIQTYINGMREGMILYGMHNFRAVGDDIAKNTFLADLSEADQAFALKLGKAYAKADAKKANKDLHSAIKKAAEKAEASKSASTSEATQNKPKKGAVRFEDGAKEETHKQHKKVIALSKHLARAIGMDIVFYDSRKTGKKAGQGANGYFDADTDTIYLDLQNAHDDAKTITYTLSHETVHFIKKWSPSKYNKFAEFLMEQYASHGVSAANLLKKKMVELNTDDADLAYEEMIADACETMLLDSNAMVKLMELRKSDLELFEKIKLHVLKILNDIREAYKSLGYEPSSDEAKALLKMKDVLEQFYSMFEEAAVDATKNYQALGTEGYNEFVAKAVNKAGKSSLDVDYGMSKAGKERVEQRYKKQAKKNATYMDAVNRGDEQTQKRIIKEAAREAGFDSPLLYHGTNAFGFTKADVSKSDDGISFFAVDSEETASTYAGGRKVKKISDASISISDEDVETIKEDITDLSTDLADYCSRTLGIRGWVDYDYFDSKLEEVFGELEKGVSATDVIEDFNGFCDELFYSFMDNYYEGYYENNPYLEDDEKITYDAFEQSEEADKLAEKFYAYVNQITSKIKTLDLSSRAGIYELYANTENHLVIEGNGRMWDKLVADNLPDIKSPEYEKYGYRGHRYDWTTRSVAAYAKDLGYSGVTFKDIIDSGDGSYIKPATVYIFFNPQEQVKSADPITYDDNGNIILPSERFNKKNTSIKYSIKRTRNMSWVAQLSEVETQKAKRSDSLYIGKITSLNPIFGEAPFAMNQSDYRKSRRVAGNNKNYSSHAVPYAFFKGMPQFMFNAPLLIDNGEKASIITSYEMKDTNGKDSYVIVGAWKNQFMENDPINQAKSTYPLDDFVERITQAAESGRLVLVNKNKAEQMLATVGVQPSEVSRIISLARGIIPQPTASVNTSTKKTSSPQQKKKVSNRTILANALETTAQNDIEKNKLAQYKEKIALVESEEEKLAELRGKIKELSFAPGRRDTEVIKKLQFEAKQAENRINTYDRQLLNLESTTALKGVLEREKQKAYQRAEQKGKEALDAYREKMTKTQQELLTRYQESRKKGVESRNKTEMRHKIKKVVGDLKALLLDPTKDKHVPIGLQKPVAEALDIINMDTVGADERIAKYNALIAKAKDPDVIAELTKSRDRIELQGANLSDKLTALKLAYAEIKNSDDPLVKNSHNEAIEDLIANTAEEVGNTSIRDMSYEQLEAVYDMYKAILATVRNANKMFKADKQETITENSELVKSEVKEAGGHRERVLKATKWLKKFGWNMLKPIYAMKMIGSNTLTRLYENVRKGEDTWAVDVNEAREFFRETAKKYNYNSWDLKKQYTFKDSTGKSFSLTIEQIMSLYAYSKRKQADKHLEDGGFIFDDSIEVTEKNKLGIPLKYEVNDANPYRLKKDAIGEIISLLDTDLKEVKGFVDEMQAYLSDVMGAKGNEVSLAMYDIKLYKEKNYFPLKTAKYFREFDPEKNGTPKIKNSGFSKKTVPQAGNPIILANFMDVWANHVNDMSMYHAFVLPLEDFMRVYNYSSTAGGYDSVQQYIKNAYGSQANTYIETLMNDLNGGARTDPSADVISKALSLFKKAKVFASLSVVIQQPSAIARATAYIDAKYFVDKPEATKHNETWAEVKKYAPVAIIKEMGYFDTNMGRSTVDFITSREYDGIKEKMGAVFTDSDYRDEVLSKAPALADELAWCAIWKAVKRETLHTHPNLKPNSKEFLKAVGERFTEVITNTQVYDSVLSRSAMMRSKDTGMKMATAFMAEPTTSINMVVDAIIEGKRGNKVLARKALGGVAASIILNSILVSIVYAMRDDDEDETYTEKYLESLTTELIDGFNPLTYVPFVKDLWSIMQGFDVERSDMSLAADLWESIENLFSESKSGFEKVEGIVGDISSIFGLPTANIMRDARGMYNLVMGFVKGMPTTKTGVSDAVVGAVKNSIPLVSRIVKDESKGEKLYDAIVKDDTAHVERLKSGYKDEEAATTALRKAIGDMYKSGEIDRTEASNMLTQYGGYDANETYWKLKEWDFDIQYGEDAEYSKYTDFYDAVKTGRNLKAVIKEYTDNGVKTETLASQITNYYKPLYKQMSNYERASIKGYLLNAYALLGYDRSKKSKDIDKWLED